MALKEGQFGELKVPLTWTAAVALIVAGIVAVALLVNDRRETLQNQAYGVTRQAVDTVAAPVSGAVSAPGRWTRSASDWIGDYFFAVSENRKLKAELVEMRQWRDVALAQRDINERYRTLMGLRTDPPIPMVAARVISDSRGPFANTRLADAGKDKGVVTGNPVMSEHGLIGRVVGVSSDVSRVLLLTDVTSRTPVMIDRTNARSILTGDGGPNPRLEYLRGRDPVKEGDRIVTSGDGGVLPRGLPVGVAVKALDGSWRVALFADSTPIDYVRILLFKDFAQLADQKGLSTTQLPSIDTEDPQARKPQSIIGNAVAPTPAPAPAAGAPTTPAPAAPRVQPPAATPPQPTPPATTPGTPQ
ncbi:rod shape-determining protein MreC [Caulobacter sp. NIBR2454]|uniref:rod shape-determining protein MreC n=1 Tax=Caulobacter sp. NIBR2454 TaxID=3015996 RepID=UPI0022B5EAFD|nr:rod shape-determining protein MreC [Caulobacter sp. NIBR2454]